MRYELQLVGRMETIRIIVGHSGKGVTESVYLSKEPWELLEAINTIEIPW